MNRTPIIILTKDNPEYLYVTLKSLTATELNDNPIIIVDDCSSLENSKAMLYTNEKIDVKFDDWTIVDERSSQELADKTAAKSFINIPALTEIFGIKKKFTVVKTSKYLGETYRTLFGVKLGFDLYPNSIGCVILEDDILFNKNWLNEILRMHRYEQIKSKAALISSYSEILRSEDSPSHFYGESIKGKACMVTKAFYKKLKELSLFSTMDLTGKGNVWNRLQRIAEKSGFICMTSKNSYIQNLKKRNLVNKDKILKYDQTFIMPIAWNEKF